MEGEGKENGSGTEAKHSPAEVGSESSEDQYDDLYVFIPGADPENNSQEPLISSRPPLPPPRSVATAFQLERPHFTLPESSGTMVEGQMERSQNWGGPGVRQETGDELKGEKEKKDDEKDQEEEDPYTFAEIDDTQADLLSRIATISQKTIHSIRRLISGLPESKGELAQTI
ncbi:B-cell scaffold protein [Saguinus oedipus]|uniref:B-cell scaffold protein n=1 Tax=Saguinus oedipus TaxID=9490 RepID=A0ABQ9W5J3_SAGOE|nr:B-cell scaffold protein [Saguinus oedipus]